MPPPPLQVRNDDLKHSPSLIPFEELSETERRYDYNMALETLSTLVSLGYQISSQGADHTPLSYLDLPDEQYRLSNGYKPRLLDLEGVQLPDSLEALVDKLAENAHNVWAAGRIREGWTYGVANVSVSQSLCLTSKPHFLSTYVRFTLWGWLARLLVQWV